jgi:hypothetical protein
MVPATPASLVGVKHLAAPSKGLRAWLFQVVDYALRTELLRPRRTPVARLGQVPKSLSMACAWQSVIFGACLEGVPDETRLVVCVPRDPARASGLAFVVVQY